MPAKGKRIGQSGGRKDLVDNNYAAARGFAKQLMKPHKIVLQFSVQGRQVFFPAKMGKDMIEQVQRRLASRDAEAKGGQPVYLTKSACESGLSSLIRARHNHDSLRSVQYEIICYSLASHKSGKREVKPIQSIKVLRRVAQLGIIKRQTGLTQWMDGIKPGKVKLYLARKPNNGGIQKGKILFAEFIEIIKDVPIQTGDKVQNSSLHMFGMRLFRQFVSVILHVTLSEFVKDREDLPGVVGLPFIFPNADGPVFDEHAVFYRGELFPKLIDAGMKRSERFRHTVCGEVSRKAAKSG